MLNILLVFRVTTSLPNFRLFRTSWPHIQQLQLAYSDFQKSSKIDILLGANIFYELLSGPPICRNYGEPATIPTSLDYILRGKILMSNNFQNQSSSVICHSVDLSEFLKSESIPNFELS